MATIDLQQDFKTRFAFEKYLEEAGSKSQEICEYFRKGHCILGNQCTMKHVRRNVRDKAVVCKHWLRSLCKKGAQCEFLHQYNPKKMPECWFFAKHGECSNPDCKFLHIKPEDKIPKCWDYEKGFCRKGPECQLKHVRRIACPDYLAGFCMKGPKCKFAHPPWGKERKRHKEINEVKGNYSRQGPKGPRPGRSQYVQNTMGGSRAGMMTSQSNGSSGGLHFNPFSQ